MNQDLDSIRDQIAESGRVLVDTASETMPILEFFLDDLDTVYEVEVSMVETDENCISHYAIDIRMVTYAQDIEGGTWWGSDPNPNNVVDLRGQVNSKKQTDPKRDSLCLREE